MRTKLVRIGNSRGIRLPKVLIEQCQLGDELELEVKAGHVILRPVHSARQGWEAAFNLMHERGDDTLLDGTSVHRSTEWEEAEWKWWSSDSKCFSNERLAQRTFADPCGFAAIRLAKALNS